MEQYLVPVLTFVMMLCFGGALLLQYQYRQALQRRLYRPGSALAVTRNPSEGGYVLDFIRWLGTRVSPPKASGSLVRDLSQAGLYSPHSPAIYLGLKLLLFVAGLIGFSLLQLSLQLPLARAMMLILGGAGLLFFLPNLFLQMRRQRHCTEVRHHLPDAIDLLEICVSSGMGLDTAWNLVGEEIRQVSPRLADEMALTNLEMHLGLTRTEAMRHMTERTGAEELGSLVAVLVQTERFGTSIGEVLRVFANTMRELRSQRAEESAEKMSVKMLFPMIVFIFPAIMVCAIGPAILIISQVILR